MEHAQWTQVTLDTRHTTKAYNTNHTTQKTKAMRNTDPQSRGAGSANYDIVIQQWGTIPLKEPYNESNA